MKRVFYLLTIGFYFILGIGIGIIIDKDWLSNEQMLYVQKLKTENEYLMEEKRAWARYIEDEFNEVKVYTTIEKELFHDLGNVLAEIGVTLEKLPDTVGNYHQQGIIITIGEELENTYGLLELKLEDIPKREIDLNMMYLSLLKMKEELMQ